MNRIATTVLALGLATATGAVSAQSGYDYPGQPQVDRYGESHGAPYDYAEVVRVDPVFDQGYGSRDASRQRCYTRDDGYYAGNGRYDDGYNDGYSRSGDYDGDDGRYGSRDPYGSDGYRGGSDGGRAVATVIGGVVGAVLGSKVGGGSGRYATSAIGTMVGGMAGREIYDSSQRNRYARQGSVTVCDPVPAGGGYRTSDGYEGGVDAYDVTYEYAGRRYTTRTSYHPGDRIRVRVDVRAE